jgi:hypothetical protein
MTAEEWRPVAGYEDLYEVSSLGRVRSLPREIHWQTRWGDTATRPAPAKIRKLSKDADGYPQVSLCKDGKKIHTKVHKLVAAAFLGERPEWATQINHIDKCRSNNCASNLEWSYTEHNTRHAHAKYEWDGRLRCIQELADIAGLGITTLHWRLSNGWDLETAMTKRQWERHRWNNQLEAANSKPTPNPSQIRTSLVERVQGAINDVEFPHGDDEARDAIREVAAWLIDRRRDDDWLAPFEELADLLLEEAQR